MSLLEASSALLCQQRTLLPPDFLEKTYQWCFRKVGRRPQCPWSATAFGPPWAEAMMHRVSCAAGGFNLVDLLTWETARSAPRAIRPGLQMLITYRKRRSGEITTDPKAGGRRLPFSLLNFNSPPLGFPLILAIAFGTFIMHNLTFQIFPFKAAVRNWN